MNECITSDIMGPQKGLVATYLHHIGPLSAMYHMKSQGHAEKEHALWLHIPYGLGILLKTRRNIKNLTTDGCSEARPFVSLKVQQEPKAGPQEQLLWMVATLL